MQKTKRIFVMLFVISMISVITVGASAASNSQPANIQPRYIGVDAASSNLDISSSGRADIRGRLSVNPGYSASVTVTLYKDAGSFVESWSRSGKGEIEVRESRYVTSGHDYYVTLSATIYNSSGKVVDTISKDSLVVSY